MDADTTFNIKSQLKDKFLIASPSITDPRFEKSVVLICHHNDNGAMGIVINKLQIPDLDLPLKLSDILPQIGILGDINVNDSEILNGGPVDTDRGFLLHSNDTKTDACMLHLNHDLCLSANKSLLEDLVTHNAPSKAILAIGYSQWSAGQLENEIRNHSWIITDSDPDLIFTDDKSTIWNKALSKMGISPALLAPLGGTA